MRYVGLEEAQAEIKSAGRNINNLRYADDTNLISESEELKSLLMKEKEESEKVGLKLNIQKMKIKHKKGVALQFFFTFCHKGGVLCISEVIDISPSNLDSTLCFIQPGISHEVLCI